MTMNLNCVSELDRSLPRPDELTPLSQALIPQELACAFNIPHLYTSSICKDATPSSSDGQNAFQSLLGVQSVLLPSLKLERKVDAETAACPSYVKTDREEVRPFKEANKQTSVVNQAEVGALMAGSFSSSSLGGMRVQDTSNGLSKIMSTSYSHMPESSGADVSIARTSLEDGRGGCSYVVGGLITEAANLMHLKLDPNEEVDSGPSVEPIQGTTMAVCSEDQSARTLKKPRLVWTPQLHKRFVDAVAQLGIKHAVPKTIMQLMNVDGLTRENVASHLQKYRIYLKRMQGLSTEGPSSSDHLFASTPVPPSLTASAHFLVSHHSPQQHREHAFGPMRGTSLPSILGHNAHHLPSHVVSPTASFSGFDTRATFSTVARPPTAPPLVSPEHVRESYGQHASSSSGRVLTLFPPGGS